ncbi:MAG: TonB-dependent receptor [Candidatus Acidiferrum sp.]
MSKSHQLSKVGRLFCVTVLLLIVGVPVRVHGQLSNVGTVQGTITDASGGAIPEALVVLNDLGTGNVLSKKTDSSGEYSFLLVPVGRYELTITKEGFKKEVHSEFEVHAAEHLRINETLSIGSVVEQVVVTGAPAVVNTVTANEGNTITGEQVNSLPLTNRVFTQLVSLEPGVSMPVVVDPGFGSNSSVNFSVNGVRDDENNLLVDGIRNVDTFGGNAFVVPNLFAVSEVRVENSDYSATSGRSAGAAVNLVTRSGSNQFHGNVFEFFRNNAFNAENLFSTSSPEDRHNDFGYDVGGPIKKDRLFFFWSQEWRRIVVSSGPAITVTPTALEREGNFSQSLIQPIDPTTGQPFPNNTIPQNRLNQNALLLLSTYYPMPTPNYLLDGLYNYISQAPNYTRWREELARIDYKISNTWTIFGRYTQDTNLLNNPYGLWGENAFPYVGGSTQNFPMYNWAVHASYVPSSTFFLEFSVGMYFANDKSLTNDPQSSKSRAPGLSLQQVFPLDEGDRIPTMYFNYPYAGIVEQWYFHNDAFSIPVQGQATWIHGRHTVRFGAVVSREGKSELANPSDNNTNGSYTFLGNYSNNPLADFELGLASDYTETALDPFGKYRWYNLEPYVEDQVKLLKNFTLTAALRYEYYQPEHELHNMLGGFDPALYNPADAPTVNESGEIVNNGNLLDGIIVAGHSQYPGAASSPYGQSLFPSHKDAFAPRIGFSWDPFSDGKTAVRAGYGIFYDRWGSYSQFGAYNPPFNSSVNIFNTSLDDPGGTAGTVFPAGLNTALAPWKYPSVQKWSLSVQREIAPGTSLSIGYVGTKGSHLLGFYDMNQGQPSVEVAEGNISPDYLRPYQGFDQISAYATMFNSNYNSLQASVIHRLKNGLSFQASYTFSKTLTDNPGPNGSAYASTWPQDSYDIRAEYGPADFDRTQILTFNYSWELLFFKHANRPTKAFLAGWQVSGITVFQSGAPLTVTLPNDQAGVGSYNQRPDLVGNPFQAGTIAANPTCVAPTQVHTMASWFNPCAFALNPMGTFGDEGNGVLRGPGFQNWDMGLAKNFAIHESMNLQFQLEAFNVFNHPNWGQPNLNWTNGAPLGTITSATSPRITQLSLVFSF